MKSRSGFISNSSSSSFIILSKLTPDQWYAKYYLNKAYYGSFHDCLGQIYEGLKTGTIEIPYGGDMSGEEDHILSIFPQIAMMFEVEMKEE